ncbi:glycoside hydrolase family 76 protein [Tricladium varicosporioides]|nr:glycoside hydrolase family 76 protein [Hymenoscyphus varicosporioides]
MLSASFVRWLSIVLSLTPVTLSAPTTSSTEAELALNYLQSKWYNRTSGLWDSTGWWNSGNCLTAIGDLAAIDSTVTGTAQDVFANTLVQAQKYNLQQLKVITPQFNMETFQGPNFPDTVQAVAVVNPKGFLNGYYDDEGWWALGWIQAYDVTKNQQYLQTAVDIFNDMHASPTTPCGGIWWDKAHTYVNAIANELYLSVGAHLANRVASNKTFYLTTAQNQYNWLIKSGMINSKNTINDGLTTGCVNNGGTVWSYNQGVILGALTELSTATGNSSYRTLATNIANAAITALSDSNGILHDPCEPNCGADGAQFKGIFMRNLQILQKAAPNQSWVKFLVANGASIWAYDRNTGTNALSVVWSGPFVKPANASTQSSALDALIAAQAVGGGSYQNLAIASRRGVVLEE